MFFSKLVIVAFTLAAAVAAVPAPASAKSLQSRAPKVHLMAARQEDTYNPETNSWSCQGPDGVGGCDDNGAAYTCNDDGNGGFTWVATGGNC